MTKVLAITPFFGRTGSEFALFYLLDSLKTEFDITIFTPKNNPDLQEKVDENLKLIYPKNGNKNELLLSKIYRKASLKKDNSGINDLVKNDDFDFVILNTMVSLSYFKVAKKKSKKTILYIHETELMLFHLDKTRLDYLINEVDLILCSSSYVKDFINVLDRTKNTEILYPTLDFSNFNLPIKTKSIRTSLGFNSSNFIWAMCGDVSSNKNPKMFLEAAKNLYKKDNNARFIWIGCTGLRAYEVYLENWVKKAGLKNIIIFIDEKADDYYQYINEIDGFVLTSFSESFSLVALESACFGKPVVSFPCGGVLEAVPKNRLLVTEEFSVKELVDNMYKVMSNPETKLQMVDIKKLLINDKTNAKHTFLSILKRASIIN